MTDETRQNGYYLPPIFVDGPEANYLGSPDVVAGLVGEFCARAEKLLMDGIEDKQKFKAEAEALIRRYAGIFSGKEPDFGTVKGFHGIALPQRLKVALTEFWDRRHEYWAGDAECCFFEWLFVTLAEFVKRADGDDWLLGVMVKPTVQQAVKTLLDFDRKAR